MTTTPPPLRIGMICPGYPSGVEGDYRGIFVQELVKSLKARGHRVCVLTSRIFASDEPYKKIDEQEEIHRFRFWSEGKLLAEYQRVPKMRMATYMLSGMAKGLRVFSSFGCDVIHTHFLVPTGVIGAALGVALRRPHLVTLWGSDMRMATGHRGVKPMAKWALRRSQLVTSAADHMIEQCRTLGTPPERIVKLAMGINDRFLAGDGAELRPPRSIISTRTLMDSIYNNSQLIAAMAEVHRRDNGVRCTIVGDGPDRAIFEQQAREYDLNGSIEFLGAVTPGRLAQLLREHQIYVSTSRSDGASFSLFEAMASGAYPIVSDITANREWLRHGENGLLFPLDNPPALAAMLLDALNRPEMMRQGIEHNRRVARETFTWPAVARRVEDHYRSLL